MMNFEQITTLENEHTSGSYSKRPLDLVRGSGVEVFDSYGKRYLDMTSGQGVALLGHAHPRVAEAIATQAHTLITCPEIFYNDRRAELYAELSKHLPNGLNRMFLCNSGAEANEGALKVARILTDRPKVIATMRGFHGRTMGALSLTWNKKYRDSFEDWTIPVTHVPYNDLDAIAQAIDGQTAAVVLEAIQGEGGVNPADEAYLQGVRALCSQHGTLLVFDEVQAGLGRTGRWFAFEHANIVPDIISLGKGIAGGVPMGAVVWNGAHGMLPSASHGSTFGGNPLACAASIATLQTLEQEQLPQRSHELGKWALESLSQLESPHIREVRGRGMMIGIELKSRVTPVLMSLQEQGILALTAGNNVLRLLPPLIVTEAQLQETLTAIEHALRAL